MNLNRRRDQRIYIRVTKQERLRIIKDAKATDSMTVSEFLRLRILSRRPLREIDNAPSVRLRLRQEEEAHD